MGEGSEVFPWEFTTMSPLSHRFGTQYQSNLWTSNQDINIQRELETVIALGHLAEPMAEPLRSALPTVRQQKISTDKGPADRESTFLNHRAMKIYQVWESAWKIIGLGPPELQTVKIQKYIQNRNVEISVCLTWTNMRKKDALYFSGPFLFVKQPNRTPRSERKIQSKDGLNWQIQLKRKLFTWKTDLKKLPRMQWGWRNEKYERKET